MKGKSWRWPGLDRRLANLRKHEKNKGKVTSDGSENYCSYMEVEEHNSEEEIVTLKRTKRVERVVVGTGPKTHSRTNQAEVATDNQVVVATDKAITGSQCVEVLLLQLVY